MKVMLYIWVGAEFNRWVGSLYLDTSNASTFDDNDVVGFHENVFNLQINV